MHEDQKHEWTPYEKLGNRQSKAGGLYLGREADGVL